VQETVNSMAGAEKQQSVMVHKISPVQVTILDYGLPPWDSLVNGKYVF